MKHLDGRIINLSRTGTTQPDEVEVVEGEGVSPHSLRSWYYTIIVADLAQMPSFHDIPQGDMYIEYSVVMPTEISEETRHSESYLLNVARE